jgi:hypothetical protein
MALSGWTDDGRGFEAVVYMKTSIRDSDTISPITTSNDSRHCTFIDPSRQGLYAKYNIVYVVIFIGIDIYANQPYTPHHRGEGR